MVASELVRPESNRRGSLARQEALLAFYLLMPTLFVLGLVILYPLVRGAVVSVYYNKLTDPLGIHFVGLGNYAAILQDPTFWIALQNTLVYTGVSVIEGLVIGLVLALILNSNVAFERFFRGLFLVPWVVPYVVVGFLFLYMFNGEVGIVNFILKQLGLISANQGWLDTPSLAMPTVIFANIWNQFPFYMLMILAGLQTIPREVKEAAEIDGAGAVQRFLNVTVPYLQNIVLIATILMVIRNFNNFPLIYTMTLGGPVNSTTTLVIYIYRLAFSDFSLGYASAVGIVWLLILAAVSYLYLKRFEKEAL